MNSHERSSGGGVAAAADLWWRSAIPPSAGSAIPVKCIASVAEHWLKEGMPVAAPLPAGMPALCCWVLLVAWGLQAQERSGLQEFEALHTIRGEGGSFV